MQTPDMTDANIEKIGALFPNCITERKNEAGVVERAIDFDRLRQELSKEIVEGPDERYQFTWPDKRKAMREANRSTNMTLRPCREESEDFDHTQNLYIEGDNLEVLKCLRETYLGKVKMIYIDPPYNTGKEFIYNDDFKVGSPEWEMMNNRDAAGNKLPANSDSNGRYHTDWLNMMYPRLKVAHDLLSEDGVIFISIDDGEVSNVRKICDEIFGYNNFITQFTRKGSGGRQDSTFFAIVHEYVLCYGKRVDFFESGKIKKEGESYPFQDKQSGQYYKLQLLRKWGENSRRIDRPNLFYPIKDPDGNDYYPMLNDKEEGCWRWGKETMLKNIEKGMVEFKRKSNKWFAYERIYEPKDGEFKTKLYTTIIDDISNNTGASLLKSLFNGKVFDYPKPVDMVFRILKYGNVQDGIVLDFFSGSATTAHAIMQLNAEEGCSSKFIMVQLPEPTGMDSDAHKAGYKNICEIGKERIRRAGKKIKEEHPEAKDLDTGFRVLKLDSSNMKDVFYTPGEVTQQNLFDSVENVKEDRSGEDLLFQVMLECNIPLTAKVECLGFGQEALGVGNGNALKSNGTSQKSIPVWSVNDGYLLACFEKGLTEEVITEIAKRKPYYFVMRDAGFKDDNTADNFDQIS